MGRKKQYDLPKAYRVMADYGSSGIWLIRTAGSFRHGMVEWTDLAISQGLQQRFKMWIDEYDKRLTPDEPFDTRAFNRTGKALAIQLKEELGDGCLVEYQGETDEGGLLPSDQIDVYHAQIIDDSGILGLMDADYYAAFAQSVSERRDFISCLMRAINSSTGIFWGTGYEGNWNIRIRPGFTKEKGFRYFDSLLRISSGNLVLAELGELLAGANDPLYFPHDLFAVNTAFEPGLYQCKVIQWHDHSYGAEVAETSDIAFTIELELLDETGAISGEWHSLPWHQQVL